MRLWVVVAVVAGLGCGTVTATKSTLDHTFRSRPDLDRFAVFDPARIPGIHLGAPNTFAVALWLRLTTQLGEWYQAKDLGDDRLMVLAQQTRSIVRLNPYMRVPPLFAGALYADAGGQALVDSHATLLHALNGQSGYWEYYFLLGTLYYQQYGDFEKAGRWWLLASQLPRAAPYLANLAHATLLQYTGEVDEALDRILLDHIEIPEIRSEMRELRRFQQLRRRLNTDLQRYRNQFGRFPNDPQQMVSQGFWRRIPKDPWGGEVELSGDGASVLPSDRLPVYLEKKAHYAEPDLSLERGQILGFH